MVARPTINDLAKKAGVSVATVDRVLNRRLPVREDTAIRVVEAAEAIGYHATGLLKRRIAESPKRKFGFLLQKPDAFYQTLGKELVAATKAARTVEGKPVLEFIVDVEPSIVAERLLKFAHSVDAIAVVAMDHPLVNEAVEKIITALVSDKEAVEVSETLNEKSAVLKVRVGEGDMGRIIGREGRTIKAIRSLLFYAGQKQNKRFVLDLVE